MGGGPSTVTWRGIITDPTTAKYLDAVAAEVTRMTKAAGVSDFNVTPIPGCGSYQTSTAASAGTHAGGGAVDINCEPLTDQQARILESAARKCGGTAWFRPRKAGVWQHHCHILRSDCRDLADSAAGQVRDYRRGYDGLYYKTSVEGLEAHKRLDTGNRSWVDVTWGAVQDIASTIGAIGGTVVDAAQEDVMTPAQEAKLDAVIGAISGLRSEEAGRYVTATGRFQYTVQLIKGINPADAQAVADAIPGDIAKQVADLLAKRLQS
jgi:hypothetical protein